MTDKVMFEIDFITGKEDDETRVPSESAKIGEDGA